MMGLRFPGWILGVLLAMFVWPVAAEPAAAPAQINGSVWVSADGVAMREPLRLDRLAQDLIDSPFNEFIIQAYADGEAFYNSQVAPQALGVKASFDPLAVLIDKLHKATPARRVVVWVSPFDAGREKGATLTSDKHVAQLHPQWLSRAVNGQQTDIDGRRWLEPGLPEVRQYVASLLEELARNYAVDGLYLDLMGDPSGDWGFHPVVVDQWMQAAANPMPPSSADPGWVALRCQLITQAMGELTEAVHNVKPGLEVSAGAIALGTAPSENIPFTQSLTVSRHHQDWATWLSEGLVDRLYLKAFMGGGLESEDFEAWVKYAIQTGREGGVPVAVGVAGYMNESIDALAQLRRAAELGAAGLALADFQRPVSDRGTVDLFFNALARTVLAEDYRKLLASSQPTLNPKPRRLKDQPTAAVLAAQMPQPAATSAPEPQPAATPVAAVEPSQPQPLPQPQATPGAEPVEVAVKPGLEPVDYELPPPPGLDVNVEEGVGRLLPIPAAESLPQLPSGQAPAFPRIGQPEAAPTTSGPVLVTQNEMLRQMLSEPGFSYTRRWDYLRPSVNAQAYLQENFGNIF